MPYRTKAAIQYEELLPFLAEYPVFHELTYCVKMEASKDMIGSFRWFHQIHLKGGCRNVKRCAEIPTSGKKTMLELVDGAVSILSSFYHPAKNVCSKHRYGHGRMSVGPCGNCFRHLHRRLNRKAKLIKRD